MSLNPYDAPNSISGVATATGRWPFWLTGSLLLASVALFVALPLMLALITFIICNHVAFLSLLILRRPTAAGLALLAGILMGASFYFTDWGVSSLHPRVRVCWAALIPACFCQVLLISMPLWRK